MRFQRDGNAEAIRGLFDALGRRDVDAVLECFDVGAMFEPLSTPVRERDPSEALGHTGLRRYFDDLVGTWDVFEVAIAEVREAGDHVAAIGQIRAVSATAKFDSTDPIGFVWRLRDGLVVWGKTYRTPEEALSALEQLSFAG
jgi:ketosteroid isomerase-like protein